VKTKRLAATALAIAALAACSDRESAAPTAPEFGLRFSAASTEPCGSKPGKVVTDQQALLYSGSTLSQAQDLWTLVVRDCKGNLPAAIEEMMSYVQFTINQSIAYGGTANNVNTVSHWNAAFQYVGQAAPNFLSSVLSNGGGAAVVVNPDVGQSTEVSTLDLTAAITIYHQLATGDQRTHLIGIAPYPGTGPCITGTNLTQRGPCFEFSAAPTVNPKWDPESLFGVCQPDVGPGSTGFAPALGHQPTPAGAAEIITRVTYPHFCADLAFENTGSWRGGFNGIVTRLAYLTRKALSPAKAYAAHTGIGGTGGGISPYAAVERRILWATFGATPVNTAPTATTPEIGTFSNIFAQAPGSILVQNAIGDPLSGLTAKPVVLSQAGGNCGTACGGLELAGSVTTANNLLASTGIYWVEFDALEDGPTVKMAPIVVRATGNGNALGAEIARITLKSVSSVKQIYFNNTLTSIPWAQHVSQHFKIVVDFTTNPKSTQLYIDGVPAGNATFTAGNIGRIAAEFTGIDSGVIGWDNISIERQPDN
jgi:hypothetical protein